MVTLPEDVSTMVNTIEVTEFEYPSAAVQFCTHAPYLRGCIFLEIAFSKLFGFQSNAYLYSKPATGTNNTIVITLVSPRHWRILDSRCPVYKGVSMANQTAQHHSSREGISWLL